MVMPAMIETTSVEAPTNGFSVAPASRNICGFSATTSVVDGADILAATD